MAPPGLGFGVGLVAASFHSFFFSLSLSAAFVFPDGSRVSELVN